MFKNVTKADLLAVLHEIGEDVDQSLKVCELKGLLLKSKEYLSDKEFVADFLATTVTQRKQDEELLRLRLQKEQETVGTPTPTPIVSEKISIDKLLKAVETLAIPVPKKNETWNLFFDSIERAFKHKNVPKEFKSEIVLKLIGEKAANILVYISEDDLKEYDKIKSLIIKEYEPSPSICLENFRRTKRLAGETHLQFASRLRSAFLHYCKIRSVNDFDSLVNLIISDKIFETLEPELSTHIAVRQGENWLKPEDLAKECDIYFNAKGRSFDEILRAKQNVYSDSTYESSKYIPPQLRKSQFLNENKNVSNVRECYICDSRFHIARYCPNRRNKVHDFNKCNKNPKIETQDTSQVIVNEAENHAIVTHVNIKLLESSQNSNDIKLYPLQKTSIFIGDKNIECVLDSGTEVSILNPSVIPDLKIEPKGKIILESAFKENIYAKLAYIPVFYKHPENRIFSSANILFALTDKLNCDCLLTPDMYEILIKSTSTNENGNSVAPDLSGSPSMFSSENKNKIITSDGEGGKEVPQVQLVCPPIIDDSSSIENESNFDDIFYESIVLQEMQTECDTSIDNNLGENNCVMGNDFFSQEEKICDKSITSLCVQFYFSYFLLLKIFIIILLKLFLFIVCHMKVSFNMLFDTIVCFLGKSETYVFNSKFELITDIKKLQKWALSIQRYDTFISHCPGAQLKNADSLSRLV